MKKVIALFLICYLLIVTGYLFSKNISAAAIVPTDPCKVTNSNPRVNGLITGGEIPNESKLYRTSTSACTIGNGSYILPTYNTYENWVTKYFDKSTKTGLKSTTLANDWMSQLGKKLYRVPGPVDINAVTVFTGGRTVIFIDGDLNITKNLKINAPSKALVFITGGNINIGSNVTQADGVFISFGTICTAFENGSCPSSSVITNNALTVHGSLISLKDPKNGNDDEALKLKRSLVDNSQPAELVNFEPRYLALLNDLLTSDLQVRFEDPILLDLAKSKVSNSELPLQPQLPPTPVDTTYTIFAGEDDVNEGDPGYDASATKVWIGTGPNLNNSWTGLRFRNINIPRDATINSAHLELNCATQFPDLKCHIQIYMNIAAEDTDNSLPFSPASPPSGRTRTVGINHSSNDNNPYNTPIILDEIKTQIQPIISKATWQSGNSISIIIKGTGSTAYGRKYGTSFEGAAGDTTHYPKLIINYTPK